jgi:hypothetical protein
MFNAVLLWTICSVRFHQRSISVGSEGMWRVKPVLVFFGVFTFTANVV